jgi:putative solute:sodium symporter small subunit
MQRPHDVQQRYWRCVLVITSALLVIWFGVTFVVAYFARELRFDFFGWPFSYWVAAQGALLTYVAIVVLYAYVMHRLDAAHDVDAVDD